jgi:hypothetical protein
LSGGHKAMVGQRSAARRTIRCSKFGRSAVLDAGGTRLGFL